MGDAIQPNSGPATELATSTGSRSLPPRASRRLILIAVILLLLAAAVPRLWLFRHTSGMLLGVGIESAFRMDLVRGPFDKIFTKTFGPGQTLLARGLVRLFPAIVYPTRWINLVLGLLSPALLFLILVRRGYFPALGAGFLLAFSPAHLSLSTVGTAEPLGYFLLFLGVGALELAERLHRDARRAATLAVSLGGILAFNALYLTRYETWILVPLVLFFTWRISPRLSALWALNGAAPVGWLVFSKIIYGRFFEAANLVVDQGSSVRSNVLDTIGTWYGDVGLAIVLLAVLGLADAVVRRRTNRLAVLGFTSALFVVLMLAAGKLHFDYKYVLNLAVWAHVFAGLGLGVLVAFLARRFGAHRPAFRLGALGAFPLLAFLLLLPGLGRYAMMALYQQGEVFENDRAFLAELPEIYARYADDRGRIDLLTSLENFGFMRIYAPADLARTFIAGGHDVHYSTLANLVRYLRAVDPESAADLALVVTEPFNPTGLRDDLRETQIVDDVVVERVLTSCGFRVYRLRRGM